MAAIPVTITGYMHYSDVGVGGGPMPPSPGYPTHPIAPGGEHPAHPIAPGGQPPGFWGPTDPRPTPPIANAPGAPGYQPPGIWGPPGPWPNPPIANVPGAPGYQPGHPSQPEQPPVGIWPPGSGIDVPAHPIVIPPSPVPPENLPPGAVWPPQAVVVWVPGQGFKVLPVKVSGDLPPTVTPHPGAAPAHDQAPSTPKQFSPERQ